MKTLVKCTVIPSVSFLRNLGIKRDILISNYIVTNELLPEFRLTSTKDIEVIIEGEIYFKKCTTVNITVEDLAAFKISQISEVKGIRASALLRGYCYQLFTSTLYAELIKTLTTLKL